MRQPDRGRPCISPATVPLTVQRSRSNCPNTPCRVPDDVDRPGWIRARAIVATRPAAPGGALNNLPLMDEPRWLTDEQQQVWRRFIAVLVKLPAALEAQLQRDSGLTHMGFLVLAH